MLFLDETHQRIETHTFSGNEEAFKMMDGLFNTQSTKTGAATFTVKVNGYTDFVFVNTQAETIQIVIKNDSGVTLYEETKIMKAIAAESCEEIFATQPVWIDTTYFKLCNRYVGTATITLTPRDGAVKIGKFSYGTPTWIGVVEANLTYNYEDYLKLDQEAADFESVDRWEKLTGTVWINTHYKKFARATLQKAVKKKMIWIDPFVDETFIYGQLETYRMQTDESGGKVALMTQIDITIRGII